MTTTGQSIRTRRSLLMRLRDDDDREAWRFFVETYAPVVHRFLRKQGMQDSDVQDVVQEVLLAVATDIHKFEHRSDRPGSFRRWLFIIVRNRTSDYWRREGRHARGSGESDVQELLAEISTDDDGIEKQWSREYLGELFRKAATQVQADFQDATWTAFWRTTVDQESPKNVANELGISPAAVYMAKRRVLHRIRQQIEFLQGRVL